MKKRERWEVERGTGRADPVRSNRRSASLQRWEVPRQICSGYSRGRSFREIRLFAARQLGLALSPTQFLWYVGLCGVAVVIHYTLMFLMASISFWATRAEGLMMAYYNLFSIARIPDVAFSGGARVLFTLVVPMLLIAHVPVHALRQHALDVRSILVMLVVCGGALHISRLVWKHALARYTSASS